MKVAISVHGRYHAFQLARGLHEVNCLSQVATTYPRFIARRFLPLDIKIRSAGWLEIWRRAQPRIPFIPTCDPGLHQAFGRFAARTLPSQADILVGWSSATLEAIPVARTRGTKVIIERGSTHILHQREVLEKAYGRLGLGPPPMNEEIIARELQEYEQADAIAVPARIAAQSFIKRGISSDRLIVNPYGIDLSQVGEMPDRKEGNGPVRILFVGQVGVRKGVESLLRAFTKVEGDTELHLVGPIEETFRPVLDRLITDHVIVHGPLSGSRLESVYARADIFCLPSVEEGMGLVLLEAMARGLPIVTTDVVGGADLISSSGAEGFVVPDGGTEALGQALSSLADDKDLRFKMGISARRRIEEAFTLNHYRDRAMNAYRKLLSS